MKRIRWWAGLVGSLIIAAALGGCDDDHHDSHGSGVCFLFREIEPNSTSFTAQFLDDMFVDDCFIVSGSIFDVTDVDTYRVLIQESLTMVVTLEHSPLVDFDILIFDATTGLLLQDCGVSAGTLEVCAISFTVRSRSIAVDIVVTSFVGAGTYTLTLDAQ